MSARYYRMATDTLQAACVENRMAPTFKELVEFVIANKGNKTFIGYTHEEIVNALHEGLQAQSLFYEQSLDGRICGMILAKVDVSRKLVWVEENLAMSINTLKRFAQKAQITFPSYALAGKRHGRDVYFDTTKLYTKLV